MDKPKGEHTGENVSADECAQGPCVSCYIKLVITCPKHIHLKLSGLLTVYFKM